VDYVKLDGCFATVSQMDKGYPIFGAELNKTGRPIVYMCEWAWWIDRKCYQEGYPECHHANYTAIRDICNLDRNMDDIEPSWWSLLKTIDYYDSIQDELIATAGPGSFHDPDMVMAGAEWGPLKLTVDQAKLQFAIWSMWSAPLLMWADLRTIEPQFKEILLNKAVIAIDQDPLGIMARMIIKTGNISVYVKPVLPEDKLTGDRSYAVAIMSRDLDKKTPYSVTLEELGLKHKKGYRVVDLFEKRPGVKLDPQDTFETVVNPMGVTMIKATVIV